MPLSLFSHDLPQVFICLFDEHPLDVTEAGNPKGTHKIPRLRRKVVPQRRSAAAASAIMKGRPDDRRK